MYRLGLDLGSSYSKGVLVDEKNEIVSCLAIKTGYDFHLASQKIIESLSKLKEIQYPIYSCGYGRESIKVPFIAQSEIIALAKAVFHQYRRKTVVIDIGGQDTKCIKILENGTIDNFKMNRKCAAGTGSFLEEIAYRLDISPEKFHILATEANQKVKINSFCTVFAVSEIIGMIKNGLSLPDIVLGVYHSIVDRVKELVPLEDANSSVLLTGGIPQKHPIIVKLFQEVFPNTESPSIAQFLAAYGTLL